MRGHYSMHGGMILFSIAVSLFSILCHSFRSSLVMAVDRTKFRTCSQTSFCRRHRAGKSAPLYRYKVDSSSIQFWDPRDSNHTLVAQKPADSSPGLWKSIVQRLSKDTKATGSYGDPHFRGTPRVFFASLINTSPITSTGEEERLNLSIHFHQNGVARIRITEVYSDDPSSFPDALKNNQMPFGKPRWTSDELILNMDEMIPTSDIQLITGDPLIQQLIQIVSTEYDSITNRQPDNFILLKYAQTVQWKGTQTSGKAPSTSSNMLLIQMDPFAIYLWREVNDDHNYGPPLVSINSQSLFHFEIRRNKKQMIEGDSSHNEFTTSERDLSNDNRHAETDDRHGGKTVVGYWEDGLAIYSDGTREEKRASMDTDNLKGPDPVVELMDRDEDGMWGEDFGPHHDSKPYGPMSVGLDVAFPSSKHLFGLPEHAASSLLETTTGNDPYFKEPYRLYNLDVFQYELDETMALYGEVPLIVSQSVGAGTVGVFWFNPSETFVDISDTKSGKGTNTHWISESGIFDLFLLPGPDFRTLYEQYASLTGRISLPPLFSLGYHQCRWNYRDEQDVYQVHQKFEELDYPYDVLWLDIEHTDGKRYFTWDEPLFPHPTEMQNSLFSQGRRMVTIIDPHIKRDDNYYIHKTATSLGLYIKDKDGRNDFDGWCWPGSSSYLDFTNEKVRSWWADCFSYDRYKGSTSSLFTWNDMNEPSVFNGPEVSMQKDLRNLDGVEHREWHNLYGLLFHRASTEGLIRRNKNENERPFVLSRSFFAGSQKYGAIWTGDNAAEWDHLAISTPMLLSLNTAALSFVGADVGGFFGDPEAELMLRWMQAGAYQPFFRGHAHHDAKRREPWMFGDEWTHLLRKAAMTRYALLPYWYTVFYEASISGVPVMRSMWMQYPMCEDLYELDDQYLIGSDLLVKPITKPETTQVLVSFPGVDSWYDVDSLKIVSPRLFEKTYQTVSVDVTLEKIPVFQRGGSVIPRRLRLRRSSETMKRDPYTLYIALDQEKMATGTLYADDGHSFDHKRLGNYGLATFSTVFTSFIRNSIESPSSWASDNRENHMIERIIIMGVDNAPKAMRDGARSIDFVYDSLSSVITVRKPNVSAMENWMIELEF